ncbi:hypothetical protein BDA96_01G064500 [Sorghum bicolor]|uniref:Uncharacterized protein n=2 Tax=Sorghum bicolor TaxID=4558 RepID=A0A921RXF8_SORBI|nr:hypothetical protein BDA96_01G064500 [Sorghum bicolor]OQU90860.1 hypothetical protein SORBI_3001G062750 [Sorghum bicolor]
MHRMIVLLDAWLQPPPASSPLRHSPHPPLSHVCPDGRPACLPMQRHPNAPSSSSSVQPPSLARGGPPARTRSGSSHRTCMHGGIGRGGAVIGLIGHGPRAPPLGGLRVGRLGRQHHI